ncbi:DNA-binding domain-containing protein [Undibacterium sp. Jales W-56]|uniref:HvfC/BufC N-terminal domain-containing protein n=1 Tax=Undibacterium sp. Jales W-56 TaxID=2897325 RepID=UPI0021D24B91|nr:DNA-binding domain-containing protein [Undibacterium sp. Jales W-56]MCU6435744.1 DNA-binding domain-containing protein [Undibacterium sp. Jales W-56]
MTGSHLSSLNIDTLAELQLRFSEQLLAPAVDAAELTMFSAKSQQAKARFATYRGNLTAIWNQALKNAYPVLYQLVGAEFFQQMAREYGRRYPSPSGDLNEFGFFLATFLEEEEFGVCTDYPYFSEVARLEWQVHQTYYAENKPALTLPELIGQSGMQFSEAHLHLNPACKLIVSDWASAEIWLAHQHLGEVHFPAEIHRKNHMLIHRQHWMPAVRIIDTACYLALDALSKGANVGQALELAVECDAEFQITEQLQQWFQWELFCATEMSQHTM